MKYKHFQSSIIILGLSLGLLSCQGNQNRYMNPSSLLASSRGQNYLANGYVGNEYYNRNQNSFGYQNGFQVNQFGNGHGVVANNVNPFQYSFPSSQTFRSNSALCFQQNSPQFSYQLPERNRYYLQALDQVAYQYEIGNQQEANRQYYQILSYITADDQTPSCEREVFQDEIRSAYLQTNQETSFNDLLDELQTGLIRLALSPLKQLVMRIQMVNYQQANLLNHARYFSQGRALVCNPDNPNSDSYEICIRCP